MLLQVQEFLWSPPFFSMRLYGLIIIIIINYIS